MSTLLEMSERVDAAAGPDHELDKAIAVATGWCLHPRDRQRDDSAQSDTGFTCLDCGADSWGNTGPTGQKRSAAIPAYTASLERAMELVPEGAGYNLDRYWIREGVRWKVEIATGGIPQQPRQVFVCWDAHSAALATTAAALRAIAAERNR